MKTSIGIKLADGTFFPILDEDALSEQNLELTTVRDHQESVQINLFKKTDDEEPEYISSLIVEDIADGISGDPTINLKIKLDEDKNLSAEAVDEGSGARQSLKVSLTTLDQNAFDDMDFSLSAFDDPMDDPFDISIDSPINFEDNSENDDIFFGNSETDYSQTEIYEAEKKKRPAVWLIVLLIILCIGALVVAILLLTKKMPFAEKMENTEQITTQSMNMITKEDAEKKMNELTEKPPVQDNAEKEMKARKEEEKRKAEEIAKLEEKKRQEEEKAAEAAKEEAKKRAEEEKRKADEKAKAEEKKRKEEQKQRNAESAKKAEAKKKADAEAKRKTEQQRKKAVEKTKTKQKKVIPTVTKSGVVRYKVKWGDTLWDISETFYKNPWLYKKIADHNKIKNPGFIVAGSYIEIPAK